MLLGAGEIGGDAQRTGVVAAADGELVGVGVALGRALEAPGLGRRQQAVGRLTVPLMIWFVPVEDDILVAGAAPQRLRPHPVGDFSR